MAYFLMMSAEQMALEQAADSLLNLSSPVRGRSFDTERRIQRRSMRSISVESLLEAAPASPQTLRDELRFLAAVSHLRGLPRLCLLAWIDGYTQSEIARSAGMSQQRVSMILRGALRACYDLAPVSFREFSRRSVYHKPSRTTAAGRTRRCRRCGEVYLLGLGERGYCSSACRQEALARVTRRKEPSITER